MNLVVETHGLLRSDGIKLLIVVSKFVSLLAMVLKSLTLVYKGGLVL